MALLLYSEKMSLCIFVIMNSFSSMPATECMWQIMLYLKWSTLNFVLIEVNIMPLFSATERIAINKWLEFSFTFMLLVEKYYLLICCYLGSLSILSVVWKSYNKLLSIESLSVMTLKWRQNLTVMFLFTFFSLSVQYLALIPAQSSEAPISLCM